MPEVLLPIFFIVFFMAIIFLVSKLGWGKLAQAYPAMFGFEGTKLKFRSCHINNTKYKGSVTLGANVEGLFMAASIFLFRPGHPPIFIPWTDISAKKEKIYWINVVKMTTDKVPELEIMITQKDASKLMAECKHHKIWEISEEDNKQETEQEKSWEESQEENNTWEENKEENKQKTPQKCSVCGQEIFATEIACSMCGAKISQPSSSGSTKKEHILSRLIWNVVFVIAYLYAIVFSLAIFVSGEKEEFSLGMGILVFIITVVLPLLVLHGIRSLYKKFLYGSISS